MFGWFNSQTSSAVAAGPASAMNCHTVHRPVMESLENRLVFSTVTGAEAAAAGGPVTQAETGVIELGGNLQFQTEGVRDHALANLVKATSGFKNLSGGAATTDA